LDLHIYTISKIGKRAGQRIAVRITIKYSGLENLPSYNVTRSICFRPYVTMLEKDVCSEPVASFIIRSSGNEQVGRSESRSNNTKEIRLIGLICVVGKDSGYVHIEAESSSPLVKIGGEKS
jgi:hypothetical protein